MTEQDTDSLLDRIEELETQLDKVTAELADAEANINLKADWIEATINDMAGQDEVTETYRAAIPVAYQMGLEAGASYHDEIAQHDYSGIEYSLMVGIPIANRADLEQSAKRAEMDAKTIRALTPPDDLVEQATAKVRND